MFIPIGRNTLIFIPMTRSHQKTEQLVGKPMSQTEARIVGYGTIFVLTLIVIGALISWYDSRH